MESLDLSLNINSLQEIIHVVPLILPSTTCVLATAARTDSERAARRDCQVPARSAEATRITCCTVAVSAAT